MARIKLNGKFFNNIYLGGPQGPSEEELKKQVSLVRAADAPAVDPFLLTVYTAQHNFVDQTPSPKLPLPGEPAKHEAGGDYGAYATYNESTQNSTSPLGSYLGNFTGSGLMWSAYSYSGGFLASFSRGPAPNTVYDSVGAYYDDDGNVVTNLVPGHYYTWKGWGVMYFLGTSRPSTPDAYPMVGLAEQYIGPNNHTFTFDYVRTAWRFEYTTSGAIEILHGEFI